MNLHFNVGDRVLVRGHKVATGVVSPYEGMRGVVEWVPDGDATYPIIVAFEDPVLSRMSNAPWPAPLEASELVVDVDFTGAAYEIPDDLPLPEQVRRDLRAALAGADVMPSPVDPQVAVEDTAERMARLREESGA